MIILKSDTTHASFSESYLKKICNYFKSIDSFMEKDKHIFTIEDICSEKIKIAFLEFLRGNVDFSSFISMRNILDYYGVSKEYENEIIGEFTNKYLSKLDPMGKRDKEYNFSEYLGYQTYSLFKKYASCDITDKDIVSIVDGIRIEIAIGSHYPSVLSERLTLIIEQFSNSANFYQLLVILDKLILLSEKYILNTEGFDLKLCFPFEMYDYAYFNKYDNSHLVDCIHKTDVICHEPLEDKPHEKLHTFIHILKDMDWNNVVLVGGSLGIALDPQFNYKDTETDIDLFVVGESMEIIKNKTNELIDFFYAKEPDKVEQFVSVISFTFKDQVVQLISSGYLTGYDLISDTDFSHNMCYYDGTNIMLSPSCMEAYRTRVSRVFKPSEPRVRKTLAKGFNIKGACNFQAITTEPKFKIMSSKDELKDNLVYGGLFNSFIEKGSKMHHYVLGYYSIVDIEEGNWENKTLFNCRLNDIDYDSEDKIYSLETQEKIHSFFKNTELDHYLQYYSFDSRVKDFTLSHGYNTVNSISHRTGLDLIGSEEFNDYKHTPKEGISYNDFHLVLFNYTVELAHYVNIIPSRISIGDYFTDKMIYKVISDIENEKDGYDSPCDYVSYKINTISKQHISNLNDNDIYDETCVYCIDYMSDSNILNYLEKKNKFIEFCHSRNSVNKLIYFEQKNVKDIKSVKNIITPETYPFFDIIYHQKLSDDDKEPLYKYPYSYIHIYYYQKY